MWPLPQISIETSPMRIGINTEPGKLEMHYNHAIQRIEQPKAEQTIRQPKGDMQIDQKKAWDALGITNPLVVTERIASQARAAALEGMSRIVQQGRRMAAIHTGENAIAEIAKEALPVRFNQFQYAGEARFDNVDITYTKRAPTIINEARPPVIDALPRKADIQFHRGSVEIYVRNWSQVKITPPQIDLRV